MSRPGRHLDELAHAGPEHLDPAYDALLPPGGTLVLRDLVYSPRRGACSTYLCGTR